MSKNLLSSKPHYLILDGLRGVAAIIVVVFHVFEAHATSAIDQIINHGYLAVDFFFMLSGFVIGYAYDDRWSKLTFKDFFKRRAIRLQPMVVMGMIIGAILFYFQDSSAVAPGIHEVPLWMVIIIMLIGCTILPVPPSMDIRGWSEMHPLNGPGWSLFFEYIANILYGTILRKASKTILAIVVVIAGGVLIYMAVTRGDVIGGWSLTSTQIYVGFTRLMYPFFAGLLLSRIGRLVHVKHAFLWCTLLIILILAFPRIGGSENIWMNGLYDSLNIIFLFPLIVLLGAGGEVSGKFSSKICKFLGDISYPIYITHYPIIYIYFGWVRDNKILVKDAWPMSLVVIFSAIILAYACLKLYDEPIRKWLKEKF